METTQILQVDVLDIIFEGRNKSYGAYELRKSYNNRLKTAIAAMIACCLLTFLVAVANQNKVIRQVSLVVDNTVNLQNAEPSSSPAPPPPAPKQIMIIKFTTPVLVDNTETPPPIQTVIDDIAIGAIDNPNGEMKDMIAPPVESHGVGNVTAPQADDFKGEVFMVQKEAQFPGGTDAWKRFLEHHLRAELPAENGAPVGIYSVIVYFLVDKEGNVSEVKVLNDPGYGTAAEAVRAIQDGPKWIPALQNGRNVIYRQKQTVTFRVEDAQ